MEKSINLIGTSVLLFTLFSFILIDKNATRFSKSGDKQETVSFKPGASSIVEAGLEKPVPKKNPIGK